MKKLFILTLAVFTAFSTFIMKGPTIKAAVEYKEVDGYGELESPIISKIGEFYNLENGKVVRINGRNIYEISVNSPIKSHIYGYVYQLENLEYFYITDTGIINKINIESPIISNIVNFYNLENGKQVYIEQTNVIEINYESRLVEKIGNYYKFENGKFGRWNGTSFTIVELETAILSHVNDNYYILENGKFVRLLSTTPTEIVLESQFVSLIGSYYKLENGKFVHISGTTVTDLELESPIVSFLYNDIYKLENGKFVHISGTTVTDLELESPIVSFLYNDIYKLENGKYAYINNTDIVYFNFNVDFIDGYLKGNNYIITFIGNSAYKIYFPDKRNPYPDWERDGNDYYYYTGKLGNSSAQGDHLVIESPNGRDLEYLSWLDVNAGTQIWRKFENYNEIVDAENPDFTRVALMHETVGEVKTLSFYRPSSIVDDVVTYESYGSAMAPPSALDIIQIRVPLTYDVNYYVDSELYETQRVNAGSTLIPPTAPEKENNVFVGWYADPATDIPFDRNNAIDQQTSLYAKFTPTTTGSTVTPGEDKPFDFMIPINIILMGGLAVLLVVAYKKKGKRR